MPWKETDVMKERVKFVLEWEKRWDEGEGRLNFAELCREFGISRAVGYDWVARYRDAKHDVKAIKERSRRPHRSPAKVSDEVEELLVAARKARPTWGPKKLRAFIAERCPKLAELPAPSTIGEVLRRRGLTVPRRLKRVRATRSATQPFAEVTGPNATWCVDFKGHFNTQDGRVCYPLTIIDAHSRFLIRCEGVEDPNGREVQRIFDSAFCEFGLPASIRSDNGPPFASVGAGGLTKLSVWWLRLGIRVERIEPGKPQQNGRQERFHRTLKAETAKPPHANMRAQQRAFDLFRKVYNEERPHEALGQKPPARSFALSPRRYPCPLVRLATGSPWEHIERVDKDGFVRWHEQRIFVTRALAHEDVAIEYDGASETWLVTFGPLCVGVLTESPAPTFRPTKGRMADQIDRETESEKPRKVSGMSPD
jgi:transposase InsO family protein